MDPINTIKIVIADKKMYILIIIISDQITCQVTDSLIHPRNNTLNTHGFSFPPAEFLTDI